MNDTQPPSGSSPQPNTGLSVTSLVLGILSVSVCSVLTGIPAIITGHIARSRAVKQPGVYGGAGMALGGLIMGYVSVGLTLLMIPLVAAVALPAMAKAKGRAQTIACVNNLKQVGLAARIWANDHTKTFPPSFVAMSNELATPRILVCPGDTRTKAERWESFDENVNASYELLEPNAKEDDPQKILFRCPIHGSVGLADGSVQQGSSRGRRR